MHHHLFPLSPAMPGMAPVYGSKKLRRASCTDEISLSDTDDSDLVEDTENDSFDNASVEDIKDEEEII